MRAPSRRRKLAATAMLWACVALVLAVPLARTGDLVGSGLYMALGAAALTFVIWRVRG